MSEEVKATVTEETPAKKPAAKKPATKTETPATKKSAAKTEATAEKKPAAAKKAVTKTETPAEKKPAAKAEAPEAATAPKAEKKATVAGKKVRVTLVRSTIGCLKDQKATVAALGLRKIRQSKEFPDNAAIRGMIFKVRHLVTVEEI